MSFEMLRNRVSTGCAYTTDFLLFAGALAEQRAAELQKQLEEQIARFLSMQEQESMTQAAAVTAAHGMHQPLVCCSTSSIASASHICLLCGSLQPAVFQTAFQCHLGVMSLL